MNGVFPTFMPAYQNPNRENATACQTQVATFLCPSDMPPIAGWPGGNNYLGNQYTFACDLSESQPSTVAVPSVTPQGIFYLASAVRLADITDGTSNTAFFSEKIRGQGQPNPRTDSLIFPNQTSHGRDLPGLPGPPADLAAADEPAGDELGDGRDVLHDLQPRLAPEHPDLRGARLHRHHGEHGDAGAAVELPLRRGERPLRRRHGPLRQERDRPAHLARRRDAQRRRGRSPRHSNGTAARCSESTLAARSLALTAGVLLIALVPGCGASPRAYAPTADLGPRSRSTRRSRPGRTGARPTGSRRPRPSSTSSTTSGRPGTALEGYEILAEEPGEGDAEKRYAVLLKLKKPQGEKRAQYVIIGRDPVWVFRDEDYRRTSNMGDNPRPTRRGGGR